jgi:hypothetical protein
MRLLERTVFWGGWRGGVRVVHLGDGDVLHHLHRDPLVKYVPLTYHGATLVVSRTPRTPRMP